MLYNLREKVFTLNTLFCTFWKKQKRDIVLQLKVLLILAFKTDV